jgi:hypothetical protein
MKFLIIKKYTINQEFFQKTVELGIIQSDHK